jgi:hypothetical protein
VLITIKLILPCLTRFFGLGHFYYTLLQITRGRRDSRRREKLGNSQSTSESETVERFSGFNFINVITAGLDVVCFLAG